MSSDEYDDSRVKGYDDSRIKHYHDKKLLENIRRYYKPFLAGDADGQWKLQTKDFTITDIPLGFVRIPRDKWREITASTANLLINVTIKAITLHGSSKPGDFSLLEHLTEFELGTDPPPGAADQFPPGTKKGDKLAMIDVDASWWNEEGKVTRQLVYGRITWKGFDFNQFDSPK